MVMDLAGFAVSAGSACSSGKVKSSSVLKAMGYDDGLGACALRVTLGPSTSEEQILHLPMPGVVNMRNSAPERAEADRKVEMAGTEEMNVKDGVEEETVEAVKSLAGKYKYGWETEIEMEYAPKGVNPDIVRLISDKNEEPEWMTEWRLSAFQRWEKMDEPAGRS